jgi:N6-L-threonylcarbamoyladenine synthase
MAGLRTMKILAIETSCDETAVAVLEALGDAGGATYRVLGDALYSQASKHAAYGGVYPTLAKREHQTNLVPLTLRALTEAELLKEGTFPVLSDTLDTIRDEEFRKNILDFIHTHEKPDIDLIAVTRGPGLEPALWTGVSFAEALARAWNIPILGIDHMEGHIVSALVHDGSGILTLKPPTFPILALLVSGGHTEFILKKDWFAYELVGRTKDDAIGEAFDKVARLLDLPYPGGPEVSRAAGRARERDAHHDIVFPRPLAHDATCDFSFSGLKTAVLYALQKMPKLTPEDKEHVAQAFEDAAVDITIIKTRRALEKTGAQVLAVGGGVSANTHLRSALEKMISEEFPDVSLLMPLKNLTGDNAIMIGIAGHLRAIHGFSENEPLVARGSQTLD